MPQPDRDALHHLTFEDNLRISGRSEYVFFFFFQAESTQPHSWWIPNGSSCAKRKIIRAEKSQALRPADNIVQTVSHTADRTRPRLYFLIASFISDFRFDVVPTSFIHRHLEMKCYTTLSFVGCNCSSCLVWGDRGGYYRCRWIWHPSFSTVTLHVSHKTMTSRL